MINILHSVEVKSRSEDPVSKPEVRTTYVRLAAPGPQYMNRQIVVMIPNVRAPILTFYCYEGIRHSIR